MCDHVCVGHVSVMFMNMSLNDRTLFSGFLSAFPVRSA